MNHKPKALLTFCAIVLGACLATSAAQAEDTRQKAPDWKLQDLEGKSVQLSDFKGKVVLLNFWATWCPPCRAEIADLVSLQKQYAAQGLVVIGVSMDEGGPAPVASFAKKFGINYLVVMGDEKTSVAYGGIEVLPTTYIIDRKGKIVAGLQGGTDRSEFQAKIKPVF